MSKIIIALLTDFGIYDPYAGIMKGVITGINADARLIDLSHQIPPGDIHRAAFVLWQAAQDFPPGTIFLCVVDPGVGTSRKGIFLQYNGQSFIGPDNGSFSYVTANKTFSTWELSNPEFQLDNPANTFHGRDIFAPAAAYCSLGTPGPEFGKSIQNIIQLPPPEISFKKNKLVGEVISFDRFGNTFTSLGQFYLADKILNFSSWITSLEVQIKDTTNLKIQVNDQYLPFVTTFGAIPNGACAGLIGSTGLLEIVANQHSARSLLNLELGTRIILEW